MDRKESVDVVLEKLGKLRETLPADEQEVLDLIVCRGDEDEVEAHQLGGMLQITKQITKNTSRYVSR